MSAAKKNPDEPIEPNKPDEIFSEMDNYQEKLAQEWESAKVSYQSKINEILEEFIKEKSQSGDSLSVVMPESEKTPRKSKMENLMMKAEKLLKSGESKARMLSYKTQSPSIINIDWGSTIPREPRRIKNIIFAALGMIALGWGVAFFRYPGAVTTLPYNHTTSLTVFQNKIYIVDWFRKALYIHANRRGMPLVSVENLPNDFVTGLGLAGSRMWTANGLRSEFIEHELSSEHPVIDRVPAPGTGMTGLFFDGLDLWSADDGEKILYRFRGSDVSETKETYRFEKISPIAFAINKGRVWVLVKKSRQLHEYRLEDPLRLLNRYDLDTLLKTSTASGLAFDGKTILILTDSPSQVLRISPRKLRRYIEEPQS